MGPGSGIGGGCNDGTRSQTNLHHYRRYTVRLGDHSLQNKNGPEQERAVAQSIPHPCYNSNNSDNHNHDLMLLRLRGPASLGSKVKPINLTDHCPQAGQKCTISGWGTVTSPQGSGRERRSWLAQWTPSHWQNFTLRRKYGGEVTVRLKFTSGPR